MGNAQQKHHSKGKQKEAKAGPKTLQEGFQTGDDSYERIEKDEVNGVDPLGNEAAALDDLVERLDSFSVPRKPVPPPVLDKNLVEEESSLPLSFSSGFQPGECSKNVKDVPAESSSGAPSIQERVTEIREFTGDKGDEEPLKDMDTAKSSDAAESNVGEDAAEIETEVDLPVAGVKLVDGTVELEVEPPETVAPSDEPVDDRVANKGAESLPVKATEPQHWSGMGTSEDQDTVAGAAESEFEVELPVTGVKPVGDKIEVEVGLPETAVQPPQAPLQPVTDSVPSVAGNTDAENLPVKATESRDWSERPLKHQEIESGREAASSSEEISVPKSSEDKNDGTWLEQPAVPERDLTGPERSREADEEVEMIVRQADEKDMEEFKEPVPVAEGVRSESTGTADAAQEATKTTESTSLETAVQKAGEHAEKQPHEGAGQEDSGHSKISHEEEHGGAFAESQDELRTYFAAAGDDKTAQAEDENVSTEKTEDGEASVKDKSLDTSSPVEASDLLKQSGMPVDGSPSGAVEPAEADGQAGIVLEPEQIQDLIPEADDGSVPTDQDQVGDVEDFKAEEVLKAARVTNHKDDAKEPQAESLKLQADPEESFTNEENQEKTTQTDVLEASNDAEKIAASQNQVLKDDEEAAAPPTEGSEVFKMSEPEMELAPEVRRSAEFKDVLELLPESSEDFKDAVSEMDLAPEIQAQEGVKNAEPELEVAQGSNEEPELEQTPEVQGLKHAESESQSLEDLQDAEPVFETPRGTERSKTELEPALQVQSLEDVESAEQESEPAEGIRSEDLQDAEPNFEAAPEVSEPAGEEVEHVEKQSAAPLSYLLNIGSLVRKLVPSGAHEANDAKAEETSPVVEGTEPSREEPAGESEEVDGAAVDELTPGDQESLTREAREERSLDGESWQVPADQQTDQAEHAQPALAEPMEQVDEEPVHQQADRGWSLEVQGSETARAELTKPGTENNVSMTERAGEPWDFDERKEQLNPGTSQVDLEEEQPGAFKVQPFQAPEVGQEVSQQDPPTEKEDEGSMRGGSKAKASQAVVAEEPKPSRAETAKKPNDETEAAESGALVLEPGMAGDVAPVVSELKSEPELIGETDMTKEEPSLDEHGHSRSVDSLEAQAPPQNFEPVSVSVSGYQKPERSKINNEEPESAEGDSSEAAWSEEPTEAKPVSTAAADHAALTDSYKEPDPDDVEEAKSGEPVADMQVGEEQSSSPRVKVVPGYDVAEDLHSNSEVPLASDVITEQKEAPSSSTIEGIADEEVISKMDNEPVKAGKSQGERVEVPSNVAGVEVL